MSADDDGCALAAHESGGHENPGVGPVEVRARRVNNFTPVLARDAKISLRYFAGRRIHDLTSEAKWGASSCSSLGALESAEIAPRRSQAVRCGVLVDIMRPLVVNRIVFLPLGFYVIPHFIL